MMAEQTAAPPASEAGHRASFFRQSGWLMIANVAGGMLMWAVHLLNKSKSMQGGEYGSFGTFLTVVMVLPTIPLQMVLTQQTARALANRKQEELSAVIRFFLKAITLCWLVCAVLVLVFQQAILSRWQMTDPVGLWVTLPVVLLSLWMPMFWGVLQGQQNFLWLGWSMMSNGLGRMTVACLAVLVLGAGAAGMMTGVLLGLVVAVALAAWHTRRTWLTRPGSFDRRSLVAEILPLILGFLGFQILFAADTILVKGYFSKGLVDYYVSAGTMSRALMWLVLPLASVMFPRLVHSAAKGHKTNLLGMVLLGTGVLGVLGAVSLSLIGPLIVPIMYSKDYSPVVTSILPWYVSAMVPLALANVLLNNLLARPASKLLFASCIFVLALGYLFALTRFHESLVMVLQTMGVANLVLLGVCAFFSWGRGANNR